MSEASTEVDELATELAEERIAHQEAIRRIRRLHFQYRGVSNYDVCAHCSRHAALSGLDAPWPCDTIKALDGEGSRG